MSILLEHQGQEINGACWIIGRTLVTNDAQSAYLLGDHPAETIGEGCMLARVRFSCVVLVKSMHSF